MSAQADYSDGNMHSMAKPSTSTGNSANKDTNTRTSDASQMNLTPAETKRMGRENLLPQQSKRVTPNSGKRQQQSPSPRKPGRGNYRGQTKNHEWKEDDDKSTEEVPTSTQDVIQFPPVPRRIAAKLVATPTDKKIDFRILTASESKLPSEWITPIAMTIAVERIKLMTGNDVSNECVFWWHAKRLDFWTKVSNDADYAQRQINHARRVLGNKKLDPDRMSPKTVPDLYTGMSGQYRRVMDKKCAPPQMIDVIQEFTNRYMQPHSKKFIDTLYKEQLSRTDLYGLLSRPGAIFNQAALYGIFGKKVFNPETHFTYPRLYTVPEPEEDDGYKVVPPAKSTTITPVSAMELADDSHPLTDLRSPSIKLGFTQDSLYQTLSNLKNSRQYRSQLQHHLTRYVFQVHGPATGKILPILQANEQIISNDLLTQLLMSSGSLERLMRRRNILRPPTEEELTLPKTNYYYILDEEDMPDDNSSDQGGQTRGRNELARSSGCAGTPKDHNAKDDQSEETVIVSNKKSVNENVLRNTQDTIPESSEVDDYIESYNTDGEPTDNDDTGDTYDPESTHDEVSTSEEQQESGGQEHQDSSKSQSSHKSDTELMPPPPPRIPMQDADNDEPPFIPYDERMISIAHSTFPAYRTIRTHQMTLHQRRFVRYHVGLVYNGDDLSGYEVAMKWVVATAGVVDDGGRSYQLVPKEEGTMVTCTKYSYPTSEDKWEPYLHCNRRNFDGAGCYVELVVQTDYSLFLLTSNDPTDGMDHHYQHASFLSTTGITEKYLQWQHMEYQREVLLVGSSLNDGPQEVLKEIIDRLQNGSTAQFGFDMHIKWEKETNEGDEMVGFYIMLPREDNSELIERILKLPPTTKEAHPATWNYGFQMVKAESYARAVEAQRRFIANRAFVMIADMEGNTWNTIPPRVTNDGESRANNLTVAMLLLQQFLKTTSGDSESSPVDKVNYAFAHNIVYLQFDKRSEALMTDGVRHLWKCLKEWLQPWQYAQAQITTAGVTSTARDEEESIVKSATAVGTQISTCTPDELNEVRNILGAIIARPIEPDVPKPESNFPSNELKHKEMASDQTQETTTTSTVSSFTKSITTQDITTACKQALAEIMNGNDNSAPLSSNDIQEACSNALKAEMSSMDDKINNAIAAAVKETGKHQTSTQNTPINISSQAVEELKQTCTNLIRSELLDAKDKLSKVTVGAIRHNQTLEKLPRELATLIKNDSSPDDLRLTDLRAVVEDALTTVYDKSLPRAISEKPNEETTHQRLAVALTQLTKAVADCNKVIEYTMPKLGESGELMTPVAMANMIEVIFERMRTISLQICEGVKLGELMRQDFEERSEWCANRDYEREHNMALVADKLCSVASDLTACNPAYWDEVNESKASTILDGLKEIRQQIINRPTEIECLQRESNPLKLSASNPNYEKKKVTFTPPPTREGPPTPVKNFLFIPEDSSVRNELRQHVMKAGSALKQDRVYLASELDYYYIIVNAPDCDMDPFKIRPADVDDDGMEITIGSRILECAIIDELSKVGLPFTGISMNDDKSVWKIHGFCPTLLIHAAPLLRELLVQWLEDDTVTVDELTVHRVKPSAPSLAASMVEPRKLDSSFQEHSEDPPGADSAELHPLQQSPAKTPAKGIVMGDEAIETPLAGEQLVQDGSEGSDGSQQPNPDIEVDDSPPGILTRAQRGNTPVKERELKGNEERELRAQKIKDDKKKPKIPRAQHDDGSTRGQAHQLPPT